MTGWIRIGFFEDFGGADSLLIDVNTQGLTGLIRWLNDMMAAGNGKAIDECPGVILHQGVRIEAYCTADDVGMVTADGRAFAWRRSEEGWMEALEKLANMQESHAPCHQYLDGPTDDVQVIASIGEYGEEWWASHAH